ncbi:MAG: PhzF family isomerase [Desulfobacterales bacterium]|nr:PhzF family isomerase [Desulfobacterales bacterium]
MKKYTIYQIDAFTQTRFKGNPAGVVTNADGLSDVQMSQIARELNNSETAFLFSPDTKDCDGRIRYFTPTMEVPTCGHATIAAMYAKAIEDNLDSCVLEIKTNIGILPFEIKRTDDSIKIWMTQGDIEILPVLSNDIQNKLLDALGLSLEDIDEQCPIQIASTGHGKVMIGIKSKKELNQLNPDLHQLKALSSTIQCNGYFVFTLSLNDQDVLSHGRMFAPAIGINEDPVTGNANGPLGAYLVHNKLVKPKGDLFSFKGVQGEAINRKGIVEVRVSIKDNQPVLVKIGGDAVAIFKTYIEL